MKRKELSVVIITRNEEKMIGDCLKSVNWADEVIIIDNGSTDKTAMIAKKRGAKVFKGPTKSLQFSELRNLGLKKATGDWLLYLDADERVTPELAQEITQVILDFRFTAYTIPRRNFYLGQEVRYGGAWPDRVKRLFNRRKLKRWEKQLHEDPIFEGKIGQLQSPLIHLTHRDLTSMVEKTKGWSEIEAELLYRSGHPPVTWWRLLKIMWLEFWKRGVKQQGWRDGTVGWIEIIFQMFSRFITYARLWEKQQEKKG
jgi:glycosyltransferase involved in cell wall biosynthesis